MKIHVAYGLYGRDRRRILASVNNRLAVNAVIGPRFLADRIARLRPSSKFFRAVIGFAILVALTPTLVWASVFAKKGWGRQDV